jgi:hypothetical protein
MALIQYLTQIQFEFGAVKLLGSECARIGITRPLVVTDAGVRAAGVLQKALDALGELPVAVFDQTPSNPTEAAVRAAAAMYREATLRRPDRRRRRLVPSTAPRVSPSRPRTKALSRPTRPSKVARRRSPIACRRSLRCRPPPALAARWRAAPS